MTVNTRQIIPTALFVVLLLTTINVLLFHGTSTNDNDSNNERQNALKAATELVYADLPSIDIDYTSTYKEIWNDLVSLEQEIGTSVQKHKQEVETISSFDQDATVIGMALGSGEHILKRFVGSLRRTGYKGHIILGVKNTDIMNTSIKKYLKSQKVKYQVIQFANECKYPYPDEKNWELNACPVRYPMLKIRWARFPLVRDWLRQCTTCTGPVLFTDVNDVFFQDNPFGADAPEVKGLQVFEEHPDQRTTHWLVDIYVKACKNVQFDRVMLCSGTTIGTRQAMLSYLHTMTNEMKEWMSNEKCRHPSVGDDQAVHNYLFYQNKLLNVQSIPYRTGIASVVGFDAARMRKKYEEQLKNTGVIESKISSAPYDGANKMTWISTKYGYTDEEGYLINLDGTRIRIVHQYDRFGVAAIGFFDKRYVN